MQRQVSSLKEKVEGKYDYPIDPDEAEKSLLILKTTLEGTIFKSMGLQRKVVRVGIIASKNKRFLWTNYT